MTRRPWTAEDQIIAEVAAACGVSFAEIGRVLERAGNTVRYHVDLIAAKKHQAGSNQWREANIDRARENSRRYYKANAEIIAERSRLYYAATRANQLRKARQYYKKNIEKCRDRCQSYRKANRSKLLQNQRRYYQENIEKCRESARRSRQANIEKKREQDRQYHKANRKRKLEYNNCYYKANAEKLKEQSRRYREANLHKLRQYSRVSREIQNSRRRHYRQANIEKYREYIRSYESRKRAARKRALVPVTLNHIEIRRALWRHRCAFCGVDANHLRNYGLEQLTIEHVLALFNQGLDEASNLMPSCKSCNSSKNAAPVEEWYRRQPFFTESRWRKICRHCPGAVVGQLPLALSPADAEPA